MRHLNQSMDVVPQLCSPQKEAKPFHFKTISVENSHAYVRDEARRYFKICN